MGAADGRPVHRLFAGQPATQSQIKSQNADAQHDKARPPDSGSAVPYTTAAASNEYSVLLRVTELNGTDDVIVV